MAMLILLVDSCYAIWKSLYQSSFETYRLKLAIDVPITVYVSLLCYDYYITTAIDPYFSRLFQSYDFFSPSEVT